MIIHCNRKYKQLLNDKYTDELDDFYVSIVDNDVSQDTAEFILSKQLHYLDCTRDSNGLRLMQTIGVPYRTEMLKAIYVIETYLGGNTEYYDRLLKRHQYNLEFEIDNPPIIYVDKKSTKSNKPKIKKEKKEKTPRKTKQEKKDDKLKFKFATFNIPKINI